MSRTLLLLRHAKSSWKHEGLTDHDRPLNKRGQRDAPRMGRLLRERDLVPDRIVSSTAVRARTTAAEVAVAAGFEGEVVLFENLYLAAPTVYLELAAELAPGDRRVMFVGHNPGIEELVELLTGDAATMPTAALAWIELPVEAWSEVDKRSRGKLHHLWRPKELDD